MKDRFFTVAVILSIVAHGALLAEETDWFTKEAAKIVRIPLLLEEPPAPPPPPPKLKPKPKPKARKAKPVDLPEQIEKVVVGDGLRTGELVDAEVGDYKPGPPEPPPKPKPKTDIKKITREYLKKVRDALARYKEYPTVAQRMGLRGRVMVSFIILSNGNFDRIKVKRSSGQKMLDDAAIRTVASLSGKLNRPGELGKHRLKTSVTLHYQLN